MAAAAWPLNRYLKVVRTLLRHAAKGHATTLNMLYLVEFRHCQAPRAASRRSSSSKLIIPTSSLEDRSTEVCRYSLKTSWLKPSRKMMVRLLRALPARASCGGDADRDFCSPGQSRRGAGTRAQK
jgi:hypothetical protein